MGIDIAGIPDRKASPGDALPERLTPLGACAAVVLAAGAARRFGSPKLLMPFGESTVLGSVVRALASAGIDPIVVVAGTDVVGVQVALEGLPVEVVRNPKPDGGMLSSIQVGVAVLPATIARFLVVLGDQPRIRSEDVSHLVWEHGGCGKGIVVPTYGGKRGHPVVFAADFRGRILDLAGAQTLRDLMEAHRDDILEVGCGSDAYVSDIDTREEYEHELQRWRAER